MNTEDILMPENKIMKLIVIKWLEFLHQIIGCAPFWFYKLNKNKKKYKRKCRCCENNQLRINGEWK